jgi:serine/threonine-protein kinase
MLAGEVAWRGDNVYVIAAARLAKPPPDPRSSPGGRDVPDAAARVVLKCMARDRDARFANAEEVAMALASLTLPAGGVPSEALSAPAVVNEAKSEVKTIAVLSLRNLGPPDDGYLADGLTDDIVDLLSMTPGLRVRSRHAGTGHEGDPREIGRVLAVQVVVEGSFLKSADQLQIRVRLLGVQDGFQLWAQRFLRPAGDLFQVGDEVARAVAEALTLEHAPEAMAPLDPATIELYLRARQLYARGPDVEKALPLFHEAMARAPGHPLILAGYALAQLRWINFGDLDVSELERARDIATRAVAAAPRLPAARIALARAHFDGGDATAAAHEIARVAPTAGDDAEMNTLWGRLLFESGAIEAAIERLLLAARADPNVSFARIDLARAYEYLGERAKADAIFTAALEGPIEARRAYWLPRARFLMWRGDEEAARRLLREVEGMNGPPIWTSFLTRLIKGVAGEAALDPLIDEALGLRRGFVRMKRSAAFGAQMLSEVASVAGRTNVVLDQIEEADRLQLLDLAWLDYCPVLGGVRGHPRFVAARANVEKRAREVLAVLGA